MGSLPQLSVLKGTSRTGAKDQLNRIFENNVDKLFGHNIATKYNGKWMNEREKRKKVNPPSVCTARRAFSKNLNSFLLRPPFQILPRTKNAK